MEKKQDKLLTEQKLLRGGLLLAKAGESLEKIVNPKTTSQGLSTGYFGAESNVALSVIHSIETIINSLCDLNDRTLEQFVYDVSIASGSREALRMKQSLGSIGQIGNSLKVDSHPFSFMGEHGESIPSQTSKLLSEDK